MNNEKRKVHDFWNDASCGEDLYLTNPDKEGYGFQAKERYRLEGEMIYDLANFSDSKNLNVLEIGVGLGADHQKFAESGAKLTGIDLTERAVNYTQQRMKVFGLNSKLNVGDAENLTFDDESFDIVYSWGVLHHSPNTIKALSEVHRVLKKGGTARIMIYHKWSIVGYMLWIRYALLTLKPWMGLNKIYYNYLESPGTKAYSKSEVKKMFVDYESIAIKTPLGHADLLESEVGQRHRGFALKLAKKIWPRWLIKKLFPNSGLGMLITAVK